MKLVTATIKIACATSEVENEIESILKCDLFSVGVRNVIAECLQGNEDMNRINIVVEVDDKDVKVVYSDKKEKKDNNG